MLDNNVKTSLTHVTSIVHRVVMIALTDHKIKTKTQPQAGENTIFRI